MDKSVCILLSTYKGEKFVRQLLDSIVNQKGITKTIVVRDDGSSDGTVDILKEYEEKKLIDKLLIEPNVGFCKSFHKLMQNAIKSDYYAFADQDDIWDEDKMLVGVKALEQVDNSTPNLYWCAFRSIDKNNKVYKNNSKCIGFKKNSIPFLNALNSNDIRGCTAVFNQKMLDMMLSLDENNYRFHDWIIRLIATYFGKEIYDPNPHISYRFHETNCFGPANFSLLSFRRFLKFMKEVDLKNNRSLQAKEFYDRFGQEMHDGPEKLFVEQAIKYKDNPEVKKQLLQRKDVFKTMPLYWRIFIKNIIKKGQY